MTFAAIQTGQRVTFEDAQQQVMIGGRSYPCAFSLPGIGPFGNKSQIQPFFSYLNLKSDT
jgi:hypothetical protein